MDNSGKVVIGVVGMPGAGKSILVEVAEEKGFGIVVMGDVIREETIRQNLELTAENLGRIMLELRQKSGPAAVAKRCVSTIKKMNGKKVLVDGVRSLYESDEFRKRFSNFKLVAIHSSPKTRFERMFKRKRSDDPASWEAFLERDWRELHVGVGSAIASAEIMIVNEKGREELRKTFVKVLEDATEST